MSYRRAAFLHLPVVELAVVAAAVALVDADQLDDVDAAHTS